MSAVLILFCIVGAFSYTLIGFTAYYVSLNVNKGKCFSCHPEINPERLEMYKEKWMKEPECIIEHELGSAWFGLLWPGALVGFLVAMTIYVVAKVCYFVVCKTFYLPNNMGKRLAGWITS